MSCLSDDEFRAAFERSNVPSNLLEHSARLVDDMLAEGGVEATTIKGVDFSLVDMFIRPDGQSSAEKHLMAVLHSIGIVLMREVGLRKKKTKSDFMYYSDQPGIQFGASQREQVRGWGWFHIHALIGGQPVFTLGWPWSYSGGSPPNAAEPAAAQAERDRILEVLQWR